ncbi:hypothetical protein [Brevibacillus fluminis]|nr:hypothetical protein [Brevibacillus fluminis]
MSYKQIVQIMWILLLLIPMFVQADSGLAVASDTRQAVVVFIDGLSFADVDKLRNHPQIEAALSYTAFGAMSIRTPGARTAENAYLLMGSGTQAIYTAASGTAYSPEELLSNGEQAGERMKQVGRLDGGGAETAAVLFPGIQRLLNDNRDRPFTERIGLLGSTLKEHGMRVTLLGNNDYGTVRQRPAALFAMDREGRIADGDVTAGTLMQAPTYPYGVRTDYEKLARRAAMQQGSGITVIELGDLARLYRLQPMMSPERFERQYQAVISDLGRFLAQLTADQQAKKQMVMVASSGVNPAAQKEKSLLLPILVWQENRSGSLFSYTTRQDGLVSGLDVMPTLLSWLDLPIPAEATGHVIRAKAADGLSMDEMFARVNWIDHVYRYRSTVLSGYVIMQIVALVAGLAIWLWQRRMGVSIAEGVKRPVRIVLFSLLFYPGLLLLEPLLPWRLPPVVILALLFFVTMIIATGLEGRGFVPALMMTGGLTAAGILVDGFMGGHIISRSYLGYDPVIGARFYGLGNELEGVLIGASILFAAAVYERGGRRWGWICDFAAILVFGVVLIYMALPSLGANAGGFLAGAIGFGMAMLRFRQVTIKKRELLLFAGILAGGIGILIVANLWSAEPLTHVGKVAKQIMAGDWAAIAQIVERKLAMNVRLIRVSLWSKGFFVSLIALGVLTFWSGRFMQHLARKWPFLIGGFRGIVAGSLAGLILNDSGIISAATSIIFFAIPALYAALDDRALSADRSA